MLTEEKYGQSSGICWGCGGAGPKSGRMMVRINKHTLLTYKNI